MARAELIVRKGAKGSEVQVVAGRPDGEPFRGPAGRSWASFTISDGGATYEWATAVDRAVNLARRVVHGEVPLERALEDDDLAKCVTWEQELREGDELGGADDPGGSDADREGDDAAAATVRAIAGSTSGEDYVDAFYAEDGDLHLADAARALPLPPWARLEMRSEGGVGSGYDQPAVVFTVPHTADELFAWLRRKDAGDAAARARAGHQEVRGSGWFCRVRVV